MATVTFDGPNKLIKSLTGITEHDVQIDWYSDWKEWVHLSDNAKYLAAMRSIGGDDISTVQTAGDTYFLTNGWKFEPYAEDANIVIVGNVYVDDTITYGDNRWVVPAGSWQIGVEFNVSNLVDSAIAQSSEIEHSSFGGMVHIDQTSSQSGTNYPSGNEAHPVNNIPDAKTIAIFRGFTRMHVTGTLVITQNVSDYTFFGESASRTVYALIPGCITQNTEFEHGTLTGTVNGNIVVRDCGIQTLAGIGSDTKDTIFAECMLLNSGVSITLKSGLSTPKPVHLLTCFSAVGGQDTPTIDLNGSGIECNMRDYSGGILYINYTGSQNSSIDLLSGQVKIDGTSTGAGTLVIRGVGKFSGTSGGLTVDSTHLLNPTTIANIVWDEPINGQSHGIAGTAGKRLLEMSGNIITSGTSQGPAINGNQIILDVNAETYDGAYDPSQISIVKGTGTGQSRLIFEYKGSTKTATVDRNWKILPDDTSEYVVYGHPGREHVNEGLAQGGTINTITLNNLASPMSSVYSHQLVFIRSGLGEDQVGRIESYNGTTKVATIDSNWAIIPDDTSGYVLLPAHIDYPDIANAVWDEIINGTTHNIPSSAGKRLLQLGDAIDGSVVDVSASTTVFETSLVESRDDFYNDQYVRFTSGNLQGHVRVIRAYSGINGQITVGEAMVEAPDNGIDFDIVPVHIHPIDQIADRVWDHIVANHTTAGTFGKAIADIPQDVWDNNISGSAYESDTTKAGTLVNQTNIIMSSKLVVDDGIGQSKLIIYKRDGVTPYAEWILQDKDGNDIVLQGTGPVDRAVITLL